MRCFNAGRQREQNYLCPQMQGAVPAHGGKKGISGVLCAAEAGQQPRFLSWVYPAPLDSLPKACYHFSGPSLSCWEFSHP